MSIIRCAAVLLEQFSIVAISLTVTISLAVFTAISTHIVPRGNFKFEFCFCSQFSSRV